MKISKRDFLKASGATLASLTIINQVTANTSVDASEGSNTELKNMTTNVSAITAKERFERITKAQEIMAKLNVAALILEPGAAMDYFSGIQWWRSERVTALIIPREGKVAVVCPFFEKNSILETLAVGDDVRVWQEHESPFIRIQQVLSDRGLTKGNIAFEHSVRYFVLKGLMALLPEMKDISADAITRCCRMFKSKHELELMHKANEITLTAYANVWSKLEIGMSQTDVKTLMQQAQSQLGGNNIWNMALFNEASAFPHGTKQKQILTEGSVVLMDCGCSVHGYQSDISRTFIFGEANKYQRKIWDTVRAGQQIAFEKAQLGVEAGQVDDAVREYYQSTGLGPDYKLPGLSHRTGHGIGMEGHESVNFVHGEKETLKANMCFSNEPGIYIPGKFGIRLEDCLYMTTKGPHWFTVPPKSLDSPIGQVEQLDSL